MNERIERWLSTSRTALMLALVAFAAAGCGDGGGSDEEFTPPLAAGVFVGETSQGERISIEVREPDTSSIASISVGCGGPGFDVGTLIGPTPHPPIGLEGSFIVYLTDAGETRQVTVDGRFRSQNRVKGTISGDPFCDGPFEAERCRSSGHPLDASCAVPTVSPTPTRTTTPTPTLSPTPTLTVAPTGSTPSGAVTQTPTPEPTAVCGNDVLEDDEECDGSLIDDTGCADPGACTCEDFCDEAGGELGCNDDCTVDFSGCTNQECSF